MRTENAAQDFAFATRIANWLQAPFSDLDILSLGQVLAEANESRPQSDRVLHMPLLGQPSCHVEALSHREVPLEQVQRY